MLFIVSSRRLFFCLVLWIHYNLYNIGPFNALWLVDLSNLTLEMKSLTLENGIFLRQVTEAEKARIITEKEHTLKEGLPLIPALLPIDVPNVYLEIHHTVDKLTFPDQQAATNIAQAVILALRLIKANPVGISFYRWEVPAQPFWFTQGIPLLQMISSLMFHPSNYLPHPAFIGERYVLTQKDADALQKLWRKVKKAYNKTELSTVLTRFEDAYTRTKPQDKLIDYWTALEALFFTQDEFYDMGKSLALAASYYLGRTRAARSTIYNDLTRSHTLRSYYVHGERRKPKVDLNEMETKTGDHLRNALRKRIEE